MRIQTKISATIIVTTHQRAKFQQPLLACDGASIVFQQDTTWHALSTEFF